jgi:RNA polymerase sigma factor (sigma-70 family)
VSRISKATICKTNLLKISRFINKLSKHPLYNAEDIKFIDESLHELIQKEARLLRDCSEKNVTEFYIETLSNRLNSQNNFYDDTFWNELVVKTRDKLAAKYTSNKTFDNNIDIYFNEVKAEYIRHPMGESDELEFIPENYDIFIKNNLKTVIECAKRYQNLGLTFEDLIQAGNVGLLTALEKYDKNKANLRIKILKSLHSSPLESFTHEDAKKLVSDGFVYSKNLDKTIDKLPSDGFKNKNDFEDWINKHIKVASFASVAFMWIRAEIIIELNQVGSIIHVPQSAQKQGTSMANIIHLDSVNPHTDDCYHDNQIASVVNEDFMVEDNYLEMNERNSTFKDIVDDVLFKLNDTERRIIKKRYGIDYPYQLSINEIAENEYLSVNKVKYIINNALTKITNNIRPKDKEVLLQLLS